MDKNTIRDEMKKMRRALSPAEIAAKSGLVREKLFSVPEIKRAAAVMTYISAFREVDTAKIIETLFCENKRVAVPVSDTETETITPSYISSGRAMRKGAYGISEPDVIVPADENDFDVIIVPGIAFDKSCRRIGFGKGYYDKLLCRTRAFKIGLCYDFQLLESIPSDSHDILMDMVITEKNILRRNQNAF